MGDHPLSFALDINMVKFALTKNILGDHTQIELEAHSFDEAKRSFELISEVVLLEERFDAVACDFLDFEKEMMAKLLEVRYAGFKDGIHQMSMRRHLNRLLMNTLSAARGFVDHLPQACNRIFGEEDGRNQECVSLLSAGYDEMLGYRICEALRNHSQHSGFPVQSISYSVQMEGDLPNRRARHSISPIVDTEVLRRNGRFKRSVLTEMEAISPKLDLKQHLRDYLAGLARAHYKFRELAEPLAMGADGTLRQLIDQYRKDVPEPKSDVGLHAVSLNGSGEWIDSVPLSTGMSEYWEYLAKNNVHFRWPENSFLATRGRFDA